MANAKGGSTLNDPDWGARGRSWWSHLAVLADDSMEGRETGSPGYRRAADYVAEQFRSAGLVPAGPEGYLQPMNFVVSQLDERASSLSLIRPTGTQPLQLREAVQIAVTSGTEPDLEAEVVFAGYGLEVPELGYSDLAGLDLEGKIVVSIIGGPADIPGPIKAHYQSREERFRSLRRAGAVGNVVMTNPTVPDMPWDRLATVLLLPRMELKDRDPEDPRPLPLTLALNPDHLDVLLAGSGHSAREILQGLAGPGPLPRFPLPVRLRAHAEVQRSTRRCHNVVGILRGSDPTLANEYVVGSAHLDHLGIGEPIKGDRVYSGAMDNASGVATLIEIARQLTESGQRPKRSLVFLAVTGEEKGLLGSKYFARHPGVSGRIVADLNMDTFLPLYPMKRLQAIGLGESTLGEELQNLAHEVGVETDPEYEPERVLFIRSDQYSFVKVGVPSLMLAIGYRKGSSEQEKFYGYFRDRYHAPADDLEQPIDLVAAAQFTDLLGRFMLRVANDAEPPSWNPDSFFRTFAR